MPCSRAAADAAAAAARQQHEPEGPGLLQRAAELGGQVVGAAAGLAADAYAAAAHVVSGEPAEGEQGAAAGEQATMQPPLEGTATLAQERAADVVQPAAPGLTRLPDAAATVAAARRAGAAAAPPAAAASTAAATTAAVLPASGASPAATGRGYLPPVGSTQPVVRPAPRPSGKRGSPCLCGA